MSKRIIYQTPEGGVAVIIPSDEALATYSINQIAKKDVPAGLAYKIVDVADIEAVERIVEPVQIGQALG